MIKILSIIMKLFYKSCEMLRQHKWGPQANFSPQTGAKIWGFWMICDWKERTCSTSSSVAHHLWMVNNRSVRSVFTIKMVWHLFANTLICAFVIKTLGSPGLLCQKHFKWTENVHLLLYIVTMAIVTLQKYKCAYFHVWNRFYKAKAKTRNLLFCQLFLSLLSFALFTEVATES